jgi:hypothetical protein
MKPLLTAKEQTVLAFLLAILLLGGIVHSVRSARAESLKNLPDITNQ